MDLGASILHHKSARVLNEELGLELVYIASCLQPLQIDQKC